MHQAGIKPALRLVDYESDTDLIMVTDGQGQVVSLDSLIDAYSPLPYVTRWFGSSPQEMTLQDLWLCNMHSKGYRLHTARPVWDAEGKGHVFFAMEMQAATTPEEFLAAAPV